MEATYINTGHPDFISGHRAMAIVSDRMAASKPPPPAVDPKTGRLPPGTLNNGRDLDVDIKKEEGFFGSFWPGGKKPVQTKKGASAMEPVSRLSSSLPAVGGADADRLPYVDSRPRSCEPRAFSRSGKRWRRKSSSSSSRRTSASRSARSSTWFPKVRLSLPSSLPVADSDAT